MPDWHRAERLFVYGTLCQGEPNHHLLAGRARFLRPETCRGRLYSIDDRYPALVLDAAGRPVAGELYAPEEQMRMALFAELDLYEAVAENLYQPVLLAQPEGDWLIYTAGPGLAHYCLPERLIPGQDWRRYRADRARLNPERG